MTCRDCIRGHLQTYEANHHVHLTIEGKGGDDLLGEVKITDPKGIVRLLPMPEDAVPDCETCPKPELSPNNADVILVYGHIANQQMYNSSSGHSMGLRFEAIVAAIEWFWQAGRIADRDVVMDRIWIVDEIANRIRNAKIDAKNKEK